MYQLQIEANILASRDKIQVPPLQQIKISGEILKDSSTILNGLNFQKRLGITYLNFFIIYGVYLISNLIGPVIILYQKKITIDKQ